MTELSVKPDSQRRGWRLADDFQNTISESHRWRMVSRSHVWRPPTDAYETEPAFIVLIEVAGMREDDFIISLTDRILTVRGFRQDNSERRAYHQMEIPFGEFSSEVELPVPILTEKVEAVYRDGFLRITLPKARTQQIKVDNLE